jgi:predicted nucleotidyltransferase component of viral defense system
VPESFLQLDPVEQSQIYRALGPQLSRSPVVLEKDVWVCWALQALFTMPGRLPMAFKGGTSLSKIFGAIERFSEDLDVTLDYRGLDDTFDPFATGISKNRLRKFGDSLKSFVCDHTHRVVAPHYQRRLAAEFATEGYRVEVSDDGERLRVH